MALGAEVEVLQPVGAVLLAAGDPVEALLHLRREVVVHVVGEVLLEQAHHGERGPRGDERGAPHADVAAVHDRGDGRRVGRGPADAELVEDLHEGRLGVARRRRGAVPVRLDLGGVQAVALRHAREPLVAVLGAVLVRGGVLVPALLVGGQEAAERDDGAGRGELGVPAGRGRRPEPHGRRRPLGVGHLGGHGALPDQLVEPERVRGELAADLVRGAEGVPRGAHGLVRLLRVLRLGAVEPRGAGHEVGAVELRGLAPGGRDRLVGQRHGVGAHVGDVAVLVQLLRHLHGGAGGEAQLARRLLLQRGGGERGGRAACVGLGLQRPDRERRVLETGGQFAGGLLVQVRELVRGALEHAVVAEVAAARHPLAVHGGEPGAEGGAGVLAVGARERPAEVPVVGGHERHALALPLHDQAGGHGLHAPGGQARGDLAPQHRGDLVAVEPVQDAPGLLRVDQVLVELAQLPEGPLDGLAGDLGEGQPVDGDLGLEHLQEVPRDGLPLAVAVGGEVEGVRVLELAPELGDLLLLVRVHHVVRLEAVLHVHRELAVGTLLELRRQLRGLREVADVPHRGLDLVGVAEVPGDGLDLGGGLHDEQALARSRALGGLRWHGTPCCGPRCRGPRRCWTSGRTGGRRPAVALHHNASPPSTPARRGPGGHRRPRAGRTGRPARAARTGLRRGSARARRRS